MSFEVDLLIDRGSTGIKSQFRVPAGLTALFGPSGAGKTSVLDAVAGLIRPRRGRIAVAGEVLFDAAARIDLPPERRACGYVFQDNRLFPHRSVRDNLLFGWRLAAPERRFMAPEEAIEFLGIGHLLARMPRTLSGGEGQRVAIGRALLAGPRFLLMDEPAELARFAPPRGDHGGDRAHPRRAQAADSLRQPRSCRGRAARRPGDRDGAALGGACGPAVPG